MNYYLDTEFIERPGSIQLISIGIVDETGKNKYYAISSEFKAEEASDWVKNNVIAKLEPEDVLPRKTLIQIKEDIIKYIEFTNDCKLLFREKGSKGKESYFVKELKVLRTEEVQTSKDLKDEKLYDISYLPIDENEIKFWGYYSDYDWVVFCWLFGTMMDLPEGMPMFCLDLKQEVDVIQLPKELMPSQRRLDVDAAEGWLEEQAEKEEKKIIITQKFNGLTREAWEEKQRQTKKYNSFVTDEHNAIFDAAWNRLLHRACVVYEDQKNSEKEMKEYEDLLKELEMVVDKYKAFYNRDNREEHHIDILLKLHEANATPAEQDKGFIGKASLSLTVREAGHSSFLLANKVFGFTNESQRNAKYDWGLKLVREMLYEITGACISLALMKEDARRQQIGNSTEG